MLSTLEFAKMTMAERQRDADRSRVLVFARRIADCCTPTSLRSRVADALVNAGSVCCPSEQERLARTVGFVHAA